MEDFKEQLKRVIKRKVIDGTETGRMCFGCDNPDEFPHSCNTTFLEKLETGFSYAWIHYQARNSKSIKDRLGHAVLVEILKDMMPLSEALEKANEIAFTSAYTRTGGGSSIVSSTSDT